MSCVRWASAEVGSSRSLAWTFGFCWLYSFTTWLNAPVVSFPMHQVTLPFAFFARSGVTVLALLPTPATVLPVPPPPPELPQPAATAAHARIAPALASFLFTMFLLRAGARTPDGHPQSFHEKSCVRPYPARAAANLSGLLRESWVAGACDVALVGHASVARNRARAARRGVRRGPVERGPAANARRVPLAGE